jgi:hypothetical protein
MMNKHLLINLRTAEVRLGEGESAIVPKGLEHLPIGQEEVQVRFI